MDLQIDYQATIDTGNKVSSEAGEFKSELGKITSANNELKSYWQGQDASKYSSAVEEQAKVMTELQTTIDEIGEFLVSTGKTYREVMETNKAGIK